MDRIESPSKPAAMGRGAMNPRSPEPIAIDPHYSPQFYAELWGIGVSTVIRWFRDLPGVLKLSRPSANGKRVRVELRIPFSLAMQVYREHTK